MRRRPSRWKLWILSCAVSAGAALGFPLRALAVVGAIGPGIQPAGPPIAVTADPAGALSPSVASDPVGNFAVVWSGRELADSTSSVLVRRFDAAGHPLGGEIVVAAGVQVTSRPRIAIGPDGTMVVVWSDFWRVRARRLAPDGQPVGGVIAVSTDDNNYNADPDVAILRSGGFAVVWHWVFLSYFEPIPPTDDLRARLFNAEGTALGDDFQVSLIAVDKSQPRVAADPAGGFAVAWEEIGGYALAGAPLEVRRFAADGTPRGPEVQAAAGPHSFGPVPLFTAGGELSVAWADLGSDSLFHPAGLFAQRFAADGSLLGPKLKLADGPLLGTPPDAAQDRLGHRLLVWGTPSAGADPLLATEIRSRLFDSTWQPLQAPLRAALLTPRALNYSGYVYSVPPSPAVASGSAGFLTVWDGRPTPPSPSQITPPQVTGQILAGDCVGGTSTLCLQQDRFEISVAWKDPRSGATGTATAIPLTGDTGAFWFFSPGNAELLVKVLDGRPVNGRWWVFFGALTDLQYDVTVTDTHNGLLKVYHNPPYVFASRADVDAFSDNGVPAPAPVALPASGKAVAVSAGSAACPAGACLGAFQVSIEWIDPKTGMAHQASGVPLSDGSAWFWFFDPNNIELIVKVLDGHAVNGHWWVFYGALTDVEFTLRVDWPDRHMSRSYHNPAHHMESHGDTQAFP